MGWARQVRCCLRMVHAYCSPEVDSCLVPAMRSAAAGIERMVMEDTDEDEEEEGYFGAPGQKMMPAGAKGSAVAVH